MVAGWTHRLADGPYAPLQIEHGWHASFNKQFSIPIQTCTYLSTQSCESVGACVLCLGAAGITQNTQFRPSPRTISSAQGTATHSSRVCVPGDQGVASLQARAMRQRLAHEEAQKEDSDARLLIEHLNHAQMQAMLGAACTRAWRVSAIVCSVCVSYRFAI